VRLQALVAMHMCGARPCTACTLQSEQSTLRSPSLSNMFVVQHKAQRVIALALGCNVYTPLHGCAYGFFTLMSLRSSSRGARAQA
jgi:hypothetical protein